MDKDYTLAALAKQTGMRFPQNNQSIIDSMQSGPLIGHAQSRMG